jgi:hypothetical protein
MPIALKSGRLNFLETSGPVQACNGIALPLHVIVKGISVIYLDRNMGEGMVKSGRGEFL